VVRGGGFAVRGGGFADLLTGFISTCWCLSFALSPNNFTRSVNEKNSKGSTPPRDRGVRELNLGSLVFQMCGKMVKAPFHNLRLKSSFLVKFGQKYGAHWVQDKCLDFIHRLLGF
jgi:hypothetical protein